MGGNIYRNSRRGASRSGRGGGGGAGQEPSPAEVALGVGTPSEERFGPSQAPIHFFGRIGEQDARRSIRNTFGRDLNDREIASLSGAPADAKVSVSSGYDAKSFQLKVSHPNIEDAVRTVRKHSDGSISIHNDIFKVRQAGSGFGFDMVGRQMENASKLGVKYVDTLAARGGDYIGYKVWPKIGYDGQIGSSIRQQLPRELRGATKVSDLYRTKKGREWWEQNGNSTDMKFDLTPGSYSRKRMASYFAERGKKK